ncbi:hypothetical protein TH61_09410 [Rufibacter sp. DG15C]|uniref:DUF4919 domain-containing protein n=1 Tax=Rufibacter sp. DG15C TaxID=1379909 RepID=UPI00078BF328|nr:DUF4919 domain-containing protein [Rufibacter sp. DG15C]AMM51344.1 hypothetical protein TH61_09410 [Rufibacter sp. DG15C]
MKRFFTLLVFSVCLVFMGQAQTISKVDFTKINAAIASPKSKFYYPTLLKRYMANDVTLTTEEYSHLYYGYPKQPGYKPWAVNDKEDELGQLVLYENWPVILSTGTKLLQKDPFNLSVIYLMHMATGELRRAAESKKWLTKFDGLLAAIKASGNGRSPETAVVLVTPRDEYMFLNAAAKLRQDGAAQLVDNKYDLVKLKLPNKLNLTQVYFNIEKALAAKR